MTDLLARTLVNFSALTGTSIIDVVDSLGGNEPLAERRLRNSIWVAQIAASELRRRALS
jgi:hypothetical protein